MREFAPLLDFVTAVSQHLELQAALREIDRQFDRGSHEREKLDKMQLIIGDIARADEAVREAYDAAIHALDSGLATTVEMNYPRLGRAWLESRKAEIQRAYGTEAR